MKPTLGKYHRRRKLGYGRTDVLPIVWRDVSIFYARRFIALYADNTRFNKSCIYC